MMILDSGLLFWATLYVKCSKTHLQAYVIPNFPSGDIREPC